MPESGEIIVIDDDPDFLDYVSIILTSNGYAVQSATSADQGWEMIREQQPDLVIADVMMSYALDGWTIASRMRSEPELRDIPLIMVSAVVSDDEDGLFPANERQHLAAFLSKPIEPAELLRCVEQHLDAHLDAH